jgi:hypothetical protein
LLFEIFFNLKKMATIESKITQIEKLLNDIRIATSDNKSEMSKLDKKKNELAELESKVTSKSPDKDEEKKSKLREQIAKLEETKPEKTPKKSKNEKVKVTKEDPDDGDNESEKKATSTKPESRITRIMGPLLESFKTVMKDNGLESSADSKKDFISYVNKMTSDEYASTTLETHMKNYASKPTVTTVKELHDMNATLEEVSPGLYRNTKTKRLLTGPLELEDEEFDDAKHEGVDYVLGQTTKRLYLTNPDGPDKFVGYWSVASFYDADM